MLQMFVFFQIGFRQGKLSYFDSNFSDVLKIPVNEW